MATVGVDDAAIDTLAGLFDAWVTDITKTAQPLQNLTINAGTFTDATNLNAAVKDRATLLYTNLTNLSKSLTEMATALHAAATDYRKGEAENVVTAEFTKMNTNIKGYLPGIDETKP